MPPSLIRALTVAALLSVAGTIIGGIIAALFRKMSDKVFSFTLELTAGLMLSVICFDLLPEAISNSYIFIVLPSLSLGVIFSVALQEFIKIHTHYKRFKQTGLLMLIALLVKDLPEGLAIGSGFHLSPRLGVSLALAIALHDIPGGITLVASLRKDKDKFSFIKCFEIILLSIVPIMAGSFLGAYIGNISQRVIAACLSFAAGAMLYVSFGELVPLSKSVYKGRLSAIGCIAGVVLGLIVALEL